MQPSTTRDPGHHINIKCFALLIGFGYDHRGTKVYLDAGKIAFLFFKNIIFSGQVFR